ncbi:MAG: hypothetical protein FWG50_14085 [Kiritimatiellaeota bacterium]|nr:hypothetical protein [Kiritimatiellota bacterium]
MKKWFFILGIVSVGVTAVICAVIWLYPRSLDIALVHAEGEDIGEPMAFLPVFTPQDGIGHGEPIYDCPGADLSFDLPSADASGLRSVAMTYLGFRRILTETAPDSLAFANSDANLALFKSAPFYPDGKLSWDTFVAAVAVPALGITNAVCFCVETSAGSSVFENLRHALIFSVSNDHPPDIPRTATLGISTDYSSDGMTLTETAAGTDLFKNRRYSVRLMEISDKPRLIISDGALLTNAVFSVWETAPQSGVFRNYNEPIPTDLPPEDIALTDFTPWRLKVTGFVIPALIPLVTVSTTVDSVSDVTFSRVGGSLLSDQKFILIPDGPPKAPPPLGYVAIRSDVESPSWENPEAGKVSVTMSCRFTRPKAKPEAAHDRSGEQADEL